MLIQPSRRGFIRGLASLVAAPAVIRVAKLMPISVVEDGLSEQNLLNAMAQIRAGFGYQAPSKVIVPERMVHLAYDLLCPGLRKVGAGWANVEGLYPKIFAPQVLPLIGK